MAANGRNRTRRIRMASLIVLALLGVVGWFAVRAGLRPLRRIETTAAEIAAGQPTHTAAPSAPHTTRGPIQPSKPATSTTASAAASGPMTHQADTRRRTSAQCTW
jgi:two-component system OmpR family sensor kinase